MAGLILLCDNCFLHGYSLSLIYLVLQVYLVSNVSQNFAEILMHKLNAN